MAVAAAAVAAAVAAAAVAAAAVGGGVAADLDAAVGVIAAVAISDVDPGSAVVFATAAVVANFCLLSHVVK